MTSRAEHSPTSEVLKTGMLLILTGRTGVGKDKIMEGLLTPDLGFSRIITCASREPRLDQDKPEEDGVDYHFVKPKDGSEYTVENANIEFRAMIARGEIFEHVWYSNHYKGTPKYEILRVLNGENIIWRIDLSRAGNINDFFRQNFEFPIAQRLINCTRVYLIDVPEDQMQMIEQRARNREKEIFNPVDYRRRVVQENADIQNGKFPNVVYNREGELESAVGLLRQMVARHFNSIA